MQWPLHWRRGLGIAFFFGGGCLIKSPKAGRDDFFGEVIIQHHCLWAINGVANLPKLEKKAPPKIFCGDGNIAIFIFMSYYDIMHQYAASDIAPQKNS